MMRIICLAGLLAGGFFQPVAAAVLDSPAMTLDKTRIGFGLPVSVRLSLKNNGEELPDADLTGLETDFIVRNIERSRFSTMQAGRRVTIHETTFRLYARRPGRFRLPSIPWGGRHTRPVTVEVLPQEPDGPLIRLDVISGTTQLRVRQPVTVAIRLTTDRNLTARPELLHSAEFSIRRLPTRRQRETHGGETLYITHFSWSVMPLKPGLQELKLPLLALGGRRLLPAGSLKFEVKPLAGYIPTYVPVGSLQLKVEKPLTTGWIEEPLDWRIRLYGEGISRQGIVRLLSGQLRDTDAVRFYPVEYHREESDSGRFSLLLSIPLVPLQAGDLRLPELSIPFVDPATGHLRQARLRSSTVTIRSPLRVGLWTGALILAGAVFLLLGAHRLRRRVAMRRRSRLALAAVQAAATPDSLAHALLSWPGTQVKTACRTLMEWSKFVERQYGLQELATLAQRLEEWRWKQPDSPEEFERLKLQFVRVLK